MKARAGDLRPLIRSEDSPLVFWPSHPFRWLPRHGNPICVLEWLTQEFVKKLAHPVVYLLFVGAMTLLVALFGLPFVSSG